MGVGGGDFLPTIKRATELFGSEVKVNLYELCPDGAVIGVDGNCFLHRAVLQRGASVQAVFDEDFTPVAEEFAGWMEALMQRGIAPRICFDGDVPPCKAEEKGSRVSKSDAAKKAVLEAGREADFSQGELKRQLRLAASGCCGQAMVSACVSELRSRGLNAFVSLYEADSQLALMSRRRQVSHVLTTDSDLAVHGCRSVLLAPMGGGDDHFNFETGDLVYHVHVEKLMGGWAEGKLAADECKATLEALTSKKTKAISVGEQERHKWMAACVHEHGIVALRTLAAVLGCDYNGSGYPGVGIAKALPVVLDKAGAGVDAVFAELRRVVPLVADYQAPSAPSKRLLEAARAVLREHPRKAIGTSVTDVKARYGRRCTPVEAEAAIRTARAEAAPSAATIRDGMVRAMAAYEHALAYDIMLRRVVPISSADESVETAGALDPDELNALAAIIGLAPSDALAEQIVLGTRSPKAPYELYPEETRSEPMAIVWADGDVRDAPITPEMVPGADLVPRCFLKDWADLDKCERDHAAVIGLDAKSWDARFERKRWSTRADWAELSDNELLHHAASNLGFDQYNWPPRNDVKLHTVPQLQRWLKCRDTNSSDGSGKALNASQLKARVSEMRENEERMRDKDGPEAVTIIDPDGAGYLELCRRSERHRQRVEGKQFGRELDMPQDLWVKDLQKITAEACVVSDELAIGHWRGDTLTGGEDSREAGLAFQRICNSNTLCGLQWHHTERGKEWFRGECPAYTGSGDKYLCAVCFETKPGAEGVAVSTATQPIQWTCECLMGKDTCKHVRALAMMVAALPRRADSGLPAPSTVLENAWKGPGSGVIYEKEAPYAEVPLANANLKRAMRLAREGKSIRHAVVRLPVAACQMYDPKPADAQWPDYASADVAAARRGLWDAAKSDHDGRPSAAEALYAPRQPELSVEPPDLPPLQTRVDADSPAAVPSSSAVTNEDGILFVTYCMRMGMLEVGCVASVQCFSRRVCVVCRCLSTQGSTRLRAGEEHFAPRVSQLRPCARRDVPPRIPSADATRSL